MFESVIGALVGAVVGGAIGWLIAYWQYRKGVVTDANRSRSERAHEARLAVEAVISKLEDSRLYRVDPNHETWDKGFNSLHRTRVLFQAAKQHLRSIGETDVLAAVDQLEMAHHPLIQLSDSFEQFLAESNYEGAQRIARAGEWPDLAQAEFELRRLQALVNAQMAGLKTLASQRLTNA
jgi:hypothetical protein